MEKFGSILEKNGKKLDKRIGLFGGSFDPPHLGHLEVARRAIEEVGLDKLIVLPAYQNPLKKGSSAPPELRLNWCNRLFSPLPQVEVSRWEIDRGRVTYSYEAIDHFLHREEVPYLYFIIGTDNLLQLEKWKNIDKILPKIRLIVATRGELGEEFHRALERYPVSHLIKVNIPISSTQIRGGDFQYLPPELLPEIKEFYEVKRTGSENRGVDK
jgi:nicotinate-nucleotide adenylyltransferase